jgi:hypothetical protein
VKELKEFMELNIGREERVVVEVVFIPCFQHALVQMDFTDSKRQESSHGLFSL